MKLCVTRTVHRIAESALARAAPGADLIVLDGDGHFEPDAPEGAEVFLMSPDYFDWVRRSDAVRVAARRVVFSPELRWVHTAAAGVDHPVFRKLLGRGVRVTNSPGVHAVPIAEYVLAQMLAHVKQVREHAAGQARREYTPLNSDELGDKTLGIVGYGGIGRATARLAKAFGMRVVGTRRTRGADELVDEMLPPDRLGELLTQSDFVLIATPLTDRTRRLIGADQLARMRPEAVLINVARGEVIDEAALVTALRDGKIALAVLDVQATEPLPPDSPLWELDRCVITPHDSARSPRTLGRVVELFVANLTRFSAGEPLLHELRLEVEG